MLHLDLSEAEARQLREILGVARNELLWEIARTDNRAYRHELVVREGFLAGLLERLTQPGAEAA
jgi:hypothetical protein